MAKQMETLKEHLKAKDRELGALEDELDNKNAEINNTSESLPILLSMFSLIRYPWSNQEVVDSFWKLWSCPRLSQRSEVSATPA